MNMAKTWDPSKHPRDAVGKFRDKDDALCFEELGVEPAEELLGQVEAEYAHMPGAGDVMRDVARLEKHGFVEAKASRAVVSASTTARLNDWWEVSMASAEYADDGSYLKMPDDYTPGGGKGRALSGKRRTYRRKYQVGGMTLRMPSKAALNRFSEENNGATFDVPVTADLPDGSSVQGWVRVTKGYDNTWDAKPLGFPGAQGTLVAEGVMANLEARSQRLAPHDVTELLERRRHRIASYGVSPAQRPMRSTFITSAGYNREETLMAVEMHGKTYGYEVDPEVYEAFTESRLPGAFYNAYIKGKAPRVEVSRCSRCGRYTVEGEPHRCPVQESGPSGTNVFSVAARLRATGAASRFARVDATPEAPRPPVRQEMDVDSFLKIPGGRQGRRMSNFGAQGWTRSPVATTLAPLMDSDHVPAAYVGRKNGDDGVAHYAGLKGEGAAEVLASMRNKALGAKPRAGAPSTGDLLRAAIRSKGAVEVNGYVVPPSSPNERIAADELVVFRPDMSRERVMAGVARLGVPGLSQAKVERAVVRGQEAWRLSW